MSVYIAAAIVIDRREEVLRCEQEMPALHHLLNQFPNELDVNRVVVTAQMLFERFPPRLIQNEYKREYDNMCARQRRQRIAIAKLQRHIPPAGTLSRTNTFAAVSPWLVAGTAATASAVALCLWISRSYGIDMNTLL